MTRLPLACLIAAIAAASLSSAGQSQTASLTIDDNDSIFIDAKTASITFGKSKGEIAGRIDDLGARSLGAGTIIFRSGQGLYIIDSPLLPLGVAGGPGSREAAGPQPSQVLIEYVEPKNTEHRALFDLLKERRALETVQQIFAPFRLPTQLMIKTIGCDGLVNAWYDREDSRPTVTICYEYLQNILQSLPKDTTPAGITASDASLGQFFWIVTHEVGHAIFDIFDVPILGRQEDAADQFAAYIMLQFGKERARKLVGGAAWAFKEYIKDYRQNPKVQVQLAGFASNHGQPEERFYDLMCMAYGADSVLFADLTADGWLPPSRAPSCKNEFKTLTHAFQKQIAPHIDKDLARQVLDTKWLAQR
jgi:hypothetical protein